MLDSILGETWRKAKDTYKSIEGAVAAAAQKSASDETPKLLRKYREAMRERANRPAPPPDIHLGRKWAEDGYADEPRAASAAVFDNTAIGSSVSSERIDQVGRELPDCGGEDDDDIVDVRGAAPGRSEDSLHHPDRPHSGVAYVWKPRAPREGSCIKC